MLLCGPHGLSARRDAIRTGEMDSACRANTDGEATLEIPCRSLAVSVENLVGRRPDSTGEGARQRASSQRSNKVQSLVMWGEAHSSRRRVARLTPPRLEPTSIQPIVKQCPKMCAVLPREDSKGRAPAIVTLRESEHRAPVVIKRRYCGRCNVWGGLHSPAPTGVY